MPLENFALSLTTAASNWLSVCVTFVCVCLCLSVSVGVVPVCVCVHVLFLSLCWYLCVQVERVACHGTLPHLFDWTVLNSHRVLFFRLAHPLSLSLSVVSSCTNASWLSPVPVPRSQTNFKSGPDPRYLFSMLHTQVILDFRFVNCSWSGEDRLSWQKVRKSENECFRISAFHLGVCHLTRVIDFT